MTTQSTPAQVRDALAALSAGAACTEEGRSMAELRAALQERVWESRPGEWLDVATVIAAVGGHVLRFMAAAQGGTWEAFVAGALDGAAATEATTEIESGVWCPSCALPSVSVFQAETGGRIGGRDVGPLARVTISICDGCGQSWTGRPS